MAPTRLKQLDLLRTFAILLVMVQHFQGPAWIHRIGWTGVDLFFVLSGFLVSGLLFSEWQRFGRVDVARFLIRRGFKIYPSFWAMIAVTTIARLLRHEPIEARVLGSELLFLQNYGWGYWGSTWSLAVEEHFYFGLAWAFSAWQRRNRSGLLIGHDPRERSILRLVSQALVVVVVIRCLTVALISESHKFTYWGTHVRVDSLLFGVLIAYFYHFQFESLRAFIIKNRIFITVISIAAIVPIYHLGFNPPFVRSLGFSLLYIGHGGLMLVLIFCLKIKGRVMHWLCKMGEYSYGIYIWHLPIRSYIVDVVVARHPRLSSTPVWFAFYMVASIAGAVVMTRLIETPILAFRDRHVPARTRLMPAASVASSELPAVVSLPPLKRVLTR